MATNFSDAKLSISGEEMRDIIQRTAKFGIDNYVSMQRDCTNNWSFRNSFFFAGTGKKIFLTTTRTGEKLFTLAGGEDILD